MNLFNPIPLPYRILAVAALAAACGLTGYIHGRSFENGELAKKQVASEARVRDEERRIAKILTDSAVARAQRENKTRLIYRTITKEVVRYAQSDAGQSVCLDPEWVRFHNASALPAIPEAGGEPAGGTWAPSNVEALNTVAQNYEQCNTWREALIGWQEWYKGTGLDKQ